jgi:hypothetical protein
MSDEQPNAYDVVIADLEAERERLSITIDALRRIKNLGVPFSATASLVTGRSNVATGAAIPHDAFFGMTIPDAARKYLSWGGNKQTKSNPELCEGLLEGGFQTTAANFGESVRATLSRNTDFVKIKGQWGLKEWYGDRAGKRKPRRANVVEDVSDSDSDSSSDSSSDSDMDAGAK